MTALNNPKSILIVYHSGSGSTRTIAEVFKTKLSQSFAIDIAQVGPNPDYQIMANFDFLLFGCPTYHCRPSTSMLEFVENMPAGVGGQQKAFVFTTYGLYTGNSLRILIKALQKKNIVTTGYLKIRGPASDGALLYPSSLSFMFEYEKKVKEKLEAAISEIEHSLASQTSKLSCPAFKWYVPLNEIVTFFGERAYNSYRDRLHILDEKCTNCNLCVKNCERESWAEGTEQPVFDPVNCEFCLECVHNCPYNAIVFTEKMSDKPRLNRAFYRKLKTGLLNNKKVFVEN